MEKRTKAIVQFIRIVDRIADARKITWKIIGTYVKNLISGDGETDKLEIVLGNASNSSSRNNSIFPLINDLVVMNFVRNFTEDGGVYKATVYMLIDMTEVSFECLIHDNWYNVVFASDQLVWTSSGLSITNTYNYVDIFNMNKGIALLQRMTDLKAKNEFLLMEYTNSPEIQNVRARNVMIMQRQKKALEDGYTVFGQNVLAMEINDTRCPICLEKDVYNTVLQCGHCFCVDCLGKHMERVGDSHGKCPLCRRAIMLTLQ